MSQLHKSESQRQENARAKKCYDKEWNGFTTNGDTRIPYEVLKGGDQVCDLLHTVYVLCVYFWRMAWRMAHFAA